MLTVALSLLLFSALAQGAVPMTADRADALFQAQDWPAAARAYEELIKSGTPTPQFHLRLGLALANLGRQDEAIAQLRTAERLGASPLQVPLRLALVYAQQDKIDLAYTELMRAAANGLPALPPGVESDPHFQKLRTDSRYGALMAALDRNARPCEFDANYRQLDFWLGQWDVRGVNVPATAPAATSAITKIHNGCVVLETYTAPGFTGQSFNIYDRSHGKWHQTWVDSGGALHEYWGELRDGNMVYEGDLPPTPGQKGRQHTRMTFFNLGPGKVRQLSERTEDGGRTWRLNYDLTYTRRK